MIERIKELCNEKKTNFSAVEKALGLANASLKKANERMQAIRLKALADYFGVSMEYLLTGNSSPSEASSAEERELLRLFRNFSAEGRTTALNAIRSFQDTPSLIKNDTNEKVG